MRPLVQAVSRKSILTAVFVFALAASVAAAPQRGGGGRSGGGHSGGARFAQGVPHRPVVGPRAHFDRRRGPVIVRGGAFFDPFWGPYYPYGYGYPYAYGYPYGPYDYSQMSTGDVKTEVTPKQAEVYVDGYYAGVADDFDGAFQRLHTSPGGHAVTLRLDGYRTVTENIYVRPDSTFKLKEKMEKLTPGEVSAPVPPPAAPAEPSDSTTAAPDGGSTPQR
jgi:hypothetical protein